MSWFSTGIDQAYQVANRVGAGAAAPLPKRMQAGARSAFTTGIFSTAGGPGLQYDYSRKKGMNSQEATTNSVSGGYLYSQSRTSQIQRMAADDAETKALRLQNDLNLEDIKTRGQAAVRVRRSSINDRASTKNGTILTGPGGTLGQPNFTGSSFSTMLGM